MSQKVAVFGLHVCSVLTQHGQLIELFVSRERQDASVAEVIGQAEAIGIRPQWIPKRVG